MNKSKTPSPFSIIRKDIYTTLAIAALNGATVAQIQECAKAIAKRTPDALCKSILEPLFDSTDALTVVEEVMLYPLSERYLGTAKMNDYEYDLTLKWRDALTYNQTEVVDLIAGQFLKRGMTSGRLYLRLTHPHYRSEDMTSVDMNTFCGFTQMGLHVA